MPPLTFHPEHERHLTFEALGHCPRDYKLTREVANGERPAPEAGVSLLIGIGADALVADLWRQRQAGVSWKELGDWAVGFEKLSSQHAAETCWADQHTLILGELQLLLRDYVKQWADVRNWEVLHIDPAEQEPLPSSLLLNIPGGTFLAMPDTEFRIGGTVTIIDRKTSKFEYRPAEWRSHPQLLTQCLAAQQRYPGEPIQYMVDYMQRPSKRLQAWTLPLTMPFPFSKEQEHLAWSWLHSMAAQKTFQGQLAKIPGSIPEPWPRNPAACRTWYGRCHWEGECFPAEE